MHHFSARSGDTVKDTQEDVQRLVEVLSALVSMYRRPVSSFLVGEADAWTMKSSLPQPLDFGG